MKLNRFSTLKLNTVPKRTRVMPMISESVLNIPDHLQMHHAAMATIDNPSQNSSNSFDIHFVGDLKSTTDNDRLEKLSFKKSPSSRKYSKENDKYFVNYYFSQTITGLIINLSHFLFGPIVILPLRLIYGANLLHSMYFDFGKFYFVSEFTSWLWVMLTITFALYRPDINNQMSIVYFSTGGAILLRQVLISLKYGYYTKKNWEKMKNTYVSPEFILENLILVVWVKVPESIAEKEINVSLKKFKIDPEGLNLKFSKFPEDCVEENQLENKSICYDTEKILSIAEVAKYLIRKVTATQKVSELKINKAFGLLYIFSFVILRFYGFGFSGFRAEPFEIIYTGFSIFKAFIAVTQFIEFIYAGLYDYKRKRMLMAQCTALISKVDQKHFLFQGKDKPSIDLSDSNTVMGWYFLRRVFLDFGKRYTLRIFLYASLVLPICIFSVLFLLLQLFKVIGVEYNYYLIPLIMITIKVFAVMVQMSYVALDLNNTFPVHRDLLLESFIKAKNSKEYDEETIMSLSFVIERLKHDELVRPIQILGITINETFVIRIFLVGLTGLFAAVQLLVTHF